MQTLAIEVLEMHNALEKEDLSRYGCNADFIFVKITPFIIPS
jgi:hypothetical protein